MNHKKNWGRMKEKQSFTLVELLIAMVISTLVISGVIMSLVNSMILNEYNQGFSVAINTARAKMEEAISKRSVFSNIFSEEGSLTVADDKIDGLYRIDVTDLVASELKNVKVSVCWRARGGRIIGDCENDPDDPTFLRWKTNIPCPPCPSSPCSIETAIAKR